MSVFDRFTSAVGDLESPFYAEERQRDVWNEACAVGFQVMLWSGLLVTTAMAWFGTDGVVPWTVAVLAVIGASACTVTAVARRHGITGWEESASGRQFAPRLVVFAVLYGATVLGLLTRLPGGDGVLGGLRIGVGIGVGLAVLATVVAVVRRRRSADRGQG